MHINRLHVIRGSDTWHVIRGSLHRHTPLTPWPSCRCYEARSNRLRTNIAFRCACYVEVVRCASSKKSGAAVEDGDSNEQTPLGLLQEAVIRAAKRSPSIIIIDDLDTLAPAQVPPLLYPPSHHSSPGLFPLPDTVQRPPCLISGCAQDSHQHEADSGRASATSSLVVDMLRRLRKAAGQSPSGGKAPCVVVVATARCLLSLSSVYLSRACVCGICIFLEIAAVGRWRPRL